MKKFKFSLQKVLEIKEQLLESVKLELTNLNNELVKIDDSINSLKTEYEKLTNDFNEKSLKSVSVSEVAFYKICSHSISRQIDNKINEKNIMICKIEDKKQEIIAKNTEISGLEKLKEKELKEYNAVIAKNEELFIEEFISNKSVSKHFAI